MIEIIQDIPRIIPYSYDYKSKKQILKDKDGLLEFKYDISYLKNSFESILENNYFLLEKIRKIRNKYEHKIHDIKLLASYGDIDGMFDYSFKNHNDRVHVNTMDIVMLFKQLNTLFSQVVDDIKSWAEDNNYETHPYYYKLSRFDFKDFNSIYESDLLSKIGRMLYKF